MRLIKKVLKWSFFGGSLGAAYGLGVMHNINQQPKKRFLRKGRK